MKQISRVKYQYKFYLPLIGSLTSSTSPPPSPPASFILLLLLHLLLLLLLLVVVVIVVAVVIVDIVVIVAANLGTCIWVQIIFGIPRSCASVCRIGNLSSGALVSCRELEQRTFFCVALLQASEKCVQGKVVDAVLHC